MRRWYSLSMVIGMGMRYRQTVGIVLQLNVRSEMLQYALRKLITHNVAQQPKYRNANTLWRAQEL